MKFSTSILLTLFQSARSAIVNYHLDITPEYITLTSADGIDISRAGSLINRTFPGPLIEANEGDQLIITVTNLQDGNEASIHWHGQLQPGTPYYDGVPGVSECGISSGSTALYNFTAYPAGTYWYHSHSGTQYVEGQFGPLVVHPNSENIHSLPMWEKEVEEEFVVLFHEWNVTPPFVELAQLKDGMQLGGVYPAAAGGGSRGRGLQMDMVGSANRYNQNQTNSTNIMDMGDMNQTSDMNSAGGGGQTSEMNTNMDMGDMNQTSDMDSAGGMSQMGNMVMESDTAWPYWLVNGDAATEFHIESGKPYRFRSICATTNWNMNITVANHKMKLVMIDAGEYLEPSDIDYFQCAIGSRFDFIINSNAAPGKYPIYVTDEIGLNVAYPAYIVVDGGNATFHDFSEIDGNGVTTSVSFPAPLFEATVPAATRNITLTLGGNEESYEWSINDVAATLPSVPVYISAGEYGIKPGQILIEPLELNEVVDIVIENPTMMGHPFHSHGHTFWVIEQSGEYNDVNPIERDTINVPIKERVVIRLLADNPGPWIFHCHIDYHMVEGMAMVFTIGDPLKDWPVPETESVRFCGGNEDFDSMVRSSWTQKLIQGPLDENYSDASSVPIRGIADDLENSDVETVSESGGSSASIFTIGAISLMASVVVMAFV